MTWSRSTFLSSFSLSPVEMTRPGSRVQRAVSPRFFLSAVVICLTVFGSFVSTAHAADTNEQAEAEHAQTDASSVETNSATPSDATGGEVHAEDAFLMWQRTIAEQPTNVSALFNAGLAAARSEKLGYARLYFERARVLSPLDRDIRDSLALVKQTIGREQLESLGGETYTEGSPTGVGGWRLARLIPESLSALGLMVFLWLFALGFVAYNSRSGTRRVVSIVMMTTGFTLAVVAGTFWGGARWTGQRITPAVVVAESPVYQTTPDQLGDRRTSAELYEGALVAIEARSDTWCRIRLADETTVWVNGRAIAPLAPKDSL